MSDIRKQLRTKGEHLTVGGAISSACSFILFLAYPGMQLKTVKTGIPSPWIENQEEAMEEMDFHPLNNKQQ